MFIFVEEEDEDLPTMRVENSLEGISLVLQQAGNTMAQEVDICDQDESVAFTWSDPKGIQ